MASTFAKGFRNSRTAQSRSLHARQRRKTAPSRPSSNQHAHLLLGGRIHERRVSCTHLGSISVSGYPHVHCGIGRRLCEKRLDLWRLCHLRGRPPRLSGRGAAHQQAGANGREAPRGARPCVPRARAGARPRGRDGEDRAARRAEGASLHCPAGSCPRPGSSGSGRPRCGCSAPRRAVGCTACRREH